MIKHNSSYNKFNGNYLQQNLQPL